MSSMTNHKQQKTQSERRQLLRTQHLIQVKWQELSESQAKLDPYDPEFSLPPSLQLLQRLQEFDVEQRHLLRSINSESRATGQYLQILDRKIHLVASTLLPPFSDANGSAINISEGGLSLSVDKPVANGSTLHLVLQSQDGLLCLSTLGTVLHCKQENHRITLSIEFVSLREADRQSICRLVIRQGLANTPRLPHNTAK